MKTVFIAGNVPLITRISRPGERPVYALRSNAEVTLLFCRMMEREGKRVPGPPGKRTRGYSGFGKDYNSCVLGRISEECGGSPTA
jgi:hypothetical protein